MAKTSTTKAKDILEVRLGQYRLQILVEQGMHFEIIHPHPESPETPDVYSVTRLSFPAF